MKTTQTAGTEDLTYEKPLHKMSEAPKVLENKLYWISNKVKSLKSLEPLQWLPSSTVIKMFVSNAITGGMPRRYYAILGTILVLVCIVYLQGTPRHVIPRSLKDDDYECGCPTTNGETELHQMTRSEVI